jgi:hypothetical protein
MVNQLSVKDSCPEEPRDKRVLPVPASHVGVLTLTRRCHSQSSCSRSSRNHCCIAGAAAFGVKAAGFDFSSTGSTQSLPAIREQREELPEFAPRSFLSGTRPGKACLRSPVRAYLAHVHYAPRTGGAPGYPRNPRCGLQLRWRRPRHQPQCIRARPRVVASRVCSTR